MKKLPYLLLIILGSYIYSTPSQAEENPQKSLNIEQSELIKNLTNNSELVRQMINRAIDTRQYELLPELIKIYQQSSEIDNILVAYAQAIILSQKGEYKEAITIYRHILAENPNFQPVRFRLAQVLFEDRQSEAALAQFRKLQSENIPMDIALTIEQYIIALQKRNDWQISFGLTYLKENNINNASRADYIYVGNVPFKKTQESLPQKANGISYNLSLAKDFNLLSSHYLRAENELNGKSFWDNHSFDDLSNRINLGYLYQTAKSRIGLLPFYEIRWYGNHRYNHSYGIQFESDYWLTPKWQFSTKVELGKIKHRPLNKIANGEHILASTTLLYAFNAKSYIYSGLEIFDDRVNAKHLASQRHTLKLGWGQEWWKGISSRVQLSYGKRKFAQEHQIFNQIRQDRELNLNLTIWKRDFHFWGITPKLSYTYSKVNSNFPNLYSYRKDKFYLSFERAF